MNSQSPLMSSFLTNENKELLWSVLHSGGKFIGILDSQVGVIKNVFEQTIYEISEHYRKLNQPINLNAINKEAVFVICKKIEAVKQSQQQQIRDPFFQNPQQVYQKKQQHIPQLETIYRAEDLQKERESIFQNEFKKKEQEMHSVLKLKKPEEINFMDDNYDKPIGNDMERLLAEALASRERELEQIKTVGFTSTVKGKEVKLLQPSESKVVDVVVRENDRKEKYNEKRVSFGSELHIIENESNENIQYSQFSNEKECDKNNDEDEFDVSFIFNKFKKIKKGDSKEIKNELNDYMDEKKNNDDDTIIKISQDIEFIKNNLADLTEKINKLCNYNKLL